MNGACSGAVDQVAELTRVLAARKGVAGRQAWESAGCEWQRSWCMLLVALGSSRISFWGFRHVGQGKMLPCHWSRAASPAEQGALIVPDCACQVCMKQRPKHFNHCMPVA